MSYGLLIAFQSDFLISERNLGLIFLTHTHKICTQPTLLLLANTKPVNAVGYVGTVHTA